MESPCTDQQDTGTNTRDVSELIQCHDLWFHDGNVVLRAENTLFKVYQGVLGAKSPIFSSMLSVPQPENEEKYDGCPFIHVHDTSQEMMFFLLALFDSSIFTSPNKLTFSQVSAFARLGTKYSVQHLRAFALRLLRQMYPLSLSNFDDVYYGFHLPFSIDNGTPYDAINLARELDIIDILPAAFAYASFSTPSRIISGVTVENRTSGMNVSDKFICLLGRERLTLRRSGIDAYLIDEPQCQSRVACRTKRLMHLTPLLVADVSPLMLLIDRPFCKMCNDGFKQMLREVRQRMWDELPETFKLPSWEQLKARRKEDGDGSESE